MLTSLLVCAEKTRQSVEVSVSGRYFLLAEHLTSLTDGLFLAQELSILTMFYDTGGLWDSPPLNLN